MDLCCGVFGYASKLEVDLEGGLRKLPGLGFTAVEPLYAFPDDPALAPDSPVPGFVKAVLWNEEKVNALKPLLDELGLPISSMHVGFSFCEDTKAAMRQLLDFSKRTGIRHFMTSLEFDTVEKADAAIELLNRAAEFFKGTGVTVGYHNHRMEFQTMKTDGGEMTLMDYFLEKTSEDVKMQLDTGWAMYGGCDVMSFMEKYKNRIQSVHLKDFVKGYEKIPRDDAFAAIGEGALPLAEILAFLPKLDLIDHGLMIDQDWPAKGHDIYDDYITGTANIRKLLHE